MKRGLGSSSAGPSMINNSSNKDDDDVEVLDLPPGFRFHPTDEEIIMHYLLKKVMDRRFEARAIAEADLNKCEPWDLPKNAKMGEKEWFFFFQRDRKYPTGMRTNRATESGYWKATGKDKEICHKSRNCLIGMKKTLVFYKGRAPKGEKTNWVMHEYRLEGNLSNYNISRAAKEEFVVCRVFHKNTEIIKIPADLELSRIDSFVNHLFDSPTVLPSLADCNNNYSNNEGPYSDFVTNDQDESNEHFINPSSVFSNNHKLPYLHYDPLNFMPPQNVSNQFSSPLSTTLNPNFYPQIALPASIFPYQAQRSIGNYHDQEGLSSTISSYPANVFPLKGCDLANLGPISPKTEHFSSNNSVISQSQETGFSTENLGNEITSLESEGDLASNKKPFDQELEGLKFSPDISDLDSLWSY
ncbi:hypothetical protein OROGR_013678 [Orobanche gracilis]